VRRISYGSRPKFAAPIRWVSGRTTFPDSRLFIPKQPARYINQQDVGLHGLDQPPSLGKVVGFTDQL